MAKQNRTQSGGVDMMFYQQGDVLLFAHATIPASVKCREDGILARGEATGHAHRLDESTNGLLYEAGDGTLYVRVGAQGATILHEEHQPIKLPMDDYRIGRVREYDHFSEEARTVMD